MTITTYKAFTTALAGLSVTGVKRKFKEPPTSIGTADIPAMWPGLPHGEESAITFTGEGGWSSCICDLVIAVEPAAQDTQTSNYAKTMTIIDALSTALRSTSIGRAKLGWAITANVQVAVAGTPYWAVIATVVGRL